MICGNSWPHNAKEQKKNSINRSIKTYMNMMYVCLDFQLLPTSTRHYVKLKNKINRMEKEICNYQLLYVCCQIPTQWVNSLTIPHINFCCFVFAFLFRFVLVRNSCVLFSGWFVFLLLIFCLKHLFFVLNENKKDKTERTWS